MLKYISSFFLLVAPVIVHAQSTPGPDAISSLFKPRLTVFVAPLALADYIGGYNLRCGAEYSLGQKTNGLTEISVYMPWHQIYNYVSGFRVRQDFRKYQLNNEFFMGGSIMLKQQKLDYLAVIPITDSTSHIKPYTLKKMIVSPSFTMGYCTRISEHLYIDVSGYAGLRLKFTETDGLTPTERNSMWNYDLDYTDWDKKIMLKQGQRIGIELQASVRVGYVFS